MGAAAKDAAQAAKDAAEKDAKDAAEKDEKAAKDAAEKLLDKKKHAASLDAVLGTAIGKLTGLRGG